MAEPGYFAADIDLFFNAHGRRHCMYLTAPTIPLGKNNVTRMNSRPKKNNQYSGKACVKKLFAPLTTPAPSNGPISVPRPPTATHTAISIELAGDISLGLMMPTCGTYSAPAMPHKMAESVHTNNL